MSTFKVLELAHQGVSIAALRTKPRVLDFSDPGTGKTFVELMEFAEHRRAGGGAALVLAPRTLLKNVWVNDSQKFTPDMVTSAALAENREAAFKQHADMYITNHDAIKWLLKQPAKFFDRFETLIIDEITAFKHSTSLRSKAMAKLRKIFARRRGLTGTPTANGICDIHHQALLIDDGERLGKSFFQFRAAVCTPKQVGPASNMVKWEDKPGAEAVVSGLLADIVIRHRLEDCVDIPPNHQYMIEVELSAKHRKIYNELAQNSILELRSGTVTAINAVSLRTKLLQCLSGAIYSDDHKYVLIDSDRYELVTDLVEARRRAIVFFLWKHQKDQLIRNAQARGLRYMVIDGDASDNARDLAVKKYQNGDLDAIYAHPQSAAHGLTLTHGTTSIFASPTQNLEHYLQGLRRIYRISQTEKTETITVVARNTLDVEVAASRINKGERMEDLLTTLEAMTA